MKTTRKETVERDVPDKTLCDICKVDVHAGLKDTHACHESADATIEAHFSSSHYGEYGDDVTYEFDLCRRCFEDKVLPFLKVYGVDTTPKEYSW